MSADVEVLTSLDELARQINEAHLSAGRDVDRLVCKWVAIGTALIEARRQVPVGDWYRWIEENLTIGGNGADCYGDLRKSLVRCTAAIADATTDEDRKAWREVERRLLRAEEAVLDALHIERAA